MYYQRKQMLIGSGIVRHLWGEGEYIALPCCWLATKGKEKTIHKTGHKCYL